MGAPADLLLTAVVLLGALSLMLALRLISLPRFAQAVAGGALGLAAWSLPALLGTGHG